MQSLLDLDNFPCTKVLVEFAKLIDDEIKLVVGDAWYLRISYSLAVSPFFMVALIPALVSDSIYHVCSTFGFNWEDVMALKDFIEREIPEGVKKIGITIGMAIGAILLVSLISSSVFAVLLALKVAIGLAAVTHIGFVINENMPYIRSAWESAKEKMSESLAKGLAGFSNFFTFRAKKETGAPVVAGQEPAGRAEYVYFPGVPSRQDIYNSLPNNPLVWLCSRSTTVNSRDLSGQELEEESTPLVSPSPHITSTNSING